MYPSCQCEAWKRTLLPCKHLVAVFENFEEFGWNSLPAIYTSSPYFNLDYDVIDSVPSDKSNGEVVADEVYSITDDDVIMSELPVKRYAKRTKASSCREVLGQIKSLTYVVNDIEVLDTLEDQLKSLLELLEKNAPNDNGIVMEPQQVKRNISSITTSLPKAKKLKSSLTGRVGIAAEKRKLHTNLIIPKVEKVKDVYLTVEIAPVDDAEYDIPIKTENGDALESESNISPDMSLEEIVLTKIVPAHGKVNKRRKLKYSAEEKKCIINNEMLTDESINLAMNLLHKQYPQLLGLADSSIGKMSYF